MATQWQAIGRGKVGWYAAASNVSSSGGTVESYAREAVDGALVWDASESDSGAFERHVMSGPMLNTALPPEGVDCFTTADREAAKRMIPALGGGFETFAKLVQDQSYSGLDRVGIGIFERLLRAIPGVRFGVVRAGQVVWEGVDIVVKSCGGAYGMYEPGRFPQS